MLPKRELPWRRRQQAQEAAVKLKKTWWEKVWSRGAWTFIGAMVAWVLSNGVESLENARKLPSAVVTTYHMFQSWYHDDSKWTGSWSSREEGDLEDYKQAELPIRLSLVAEHGKVFGEMFNRSVCDLSPMLQPALVEGAIQQGKLVAYAYVYVGGERRFLYSFTATRSEDDPVLTLFPAKDPHELLPSGARLVHRYDVDQPDMKVAEDPVSGEHPDLKCPESPTDYVRRLRKEGVLKDVDELTRERKPPTHTK